MLPSVCLRDSTNIPTSTTLSEESQEYTAVRTHRESSLVVGVSKLYGSEEYSDLTIICGDSKFKVHKAIVCTQSKFFAAACRNNYIEDRTSTIELHEETDYLVQAMIQFLYTTRCQISNYEERKRGHCDHPEGEAHSCNDPSCHRWIYGFDIALYTMGDKYDIPGLRIYACLRLRVDLDYPYAYLKEKDWTLSLDVLQALYETSRTNDEFRKILVGEIEDSFMTSNLRCRPEFYEFLVVQARHGC
ncbi:multicopper oxidase abr1 [Physcia stellaris]|nr:multicopper oxidase abr1 [Physcia stellaris]